MPERPNQNDQEDQKIQKIQQIHKNQHIHRIREHGHDLHNQPKTLVVPPLGQHNHNDWKHTQTVRPQERQNDHVIAPQIDSRRLNLNPGDLRQRRLEQFQPHHQNHHHQHFEHRSYPNFGYPQQFGPQTGNWNDRAYGNPRQFHHRHFQNPYDGMNYFDRHHHHRDRDDFIPRMLEGILDGILSGSLVRELNKLKVDGKQMDETEDLDDNDRFDRALREENSPDRQISINLDFSPQGQTSGFEARFERTG